VYLECEKSGEAVTKCLFYMGYHVNIMQCMQPNFLLTGQVYPMPATEFAKKLWGVPNLTVCVSMTTKLGYIMELIPGYAHHDGIANSVFRYTMVLYLDIQHLALNLI